LPVRMFYMLEMYEAGYYYLNSVFLWFYVKKSNNKRLAVDLIWNLELVVWNLFEI